ncbi:MAG: hypothetical protein JSR91_22235, partial [Proteobacteria bacterium]|nr:hypothetical protein [Pseudomonadota bacterium]
MVNSVSGLRNPGVEAGHSGGMRHKYARAISCKLGTIWRKAKSVGRDEAGTVVMYVVAVPVFAGMVAAGAETGNFYRMKR